MSACGREGSPLDLLLGYRTTPRGTATALTCGEAGPTGTISCSSERTPAQCVWLMSPHRPHLCHVFSAEGPRAHNGRGVPGRRAGAQGWQDHSAWGTEPELVPSMRIRCRKVTSTSQQRLALSWKHRNRAWA